MPLFMLPSWKQALLPALLCLLVGSSLLFGACSVASQDPPLSDSTFSRILVDIHLLSARKARPASLPAGLYDSLLTHQGVQREDFRATLQYYTRHPDAFSSLYNNVIDTLKAITSRRRYGPSSSPGLPDSLQERMSKEAREQRR